MISIHDLARRSAALALACLMGVSCTLATAQDASPPSGKIRVACVGDSITFGAGVEDREHNAYPVVLQKLLGDKYEVRNFGVSGATALKAGDLPYNSLGQYKDALAYDPAIVIIKLGTNDSKPQNWKHRDEFAKDVQSMVDAFDACPGDQRIFLCLPVPVAQDRWGIRESVVHDEVIPRLETVAKEKHLTTINLYETFKSHHDELPDGVHPNAAGAKRMAETIAGAIAPAK